MKFPILIHLLNNKAKHIVKSFDELPFGQYFKIIQTNFLIDNTEIVVDYRVIETETPVETSDNDEPTQESLEPPEHNSEGHNTSSGS